MNRRQLQAARARAKLALLNQHKKRKPRRPYVTKSMFLRGIKGTCGIVQAAIDRLGISRECFHGLLKREDRKDVREAWHEEIEFVGDLAEITIRDAITQRLDINTAAANARWLLSRKRYQDRRFDDTQTVKLEGGDKPIEVKGTIPIETLSLSLEVRKQILEAIEAKEKQNAPEPS